MIESMAKEIRMPKLAQTSEEVRLLRWHVKVGDSVKKGDPLCEVENDKTTMDLESFADGIVLRLLAAPESEVTAGTVIALIGEPGEETAEMTPEAAPQPLQRPQPQAQAPRQPTETARATRLIRNLAQKRGIDLAAVRGTGPAGLVTRKDLEAVGSKVEAAPAAPAAAAAEEATIPLSDQQLQLGRLMTEGKARIPHYYLESTILCDRLLELREKRRARDGDKPAVDSFFILAVARVLWRLPRINSSFRDGSLHSSGQVNIAFATSVGDELSSARGSGADRKNLEEIDRDVRRLTAKARNGRLEREDIFDATFTISNLGMYPVDSFQAIITPPQVAVLAIGRIRRIMDVEDNNSFRVRPCALSGEASITAR